MSGPIPTSQTDKSFGRSAPSGRKGVQRAAARSMLLQFAVFAAAIALAICLTTFLLDPLQFYRRASLLPPVFSTEERYQNPGLAKNYDYDTIILGTSMTENFLPSVVDRALGGHSIKLSMEGSMANEQYKIAKLALETGKVKQVLWGLDFFAFKQSDDEAPDFPDYLYDSSWLNDYRYWFNASVYEMLFKNIVRLATTGANRDLEHLYNWNALGGFDAAKVVQDYRIAGQKEQYFGLNEDPLAVLQSSFESNVLSLVRQYPEVEFIFFYPPYSILRQDVWKRTNELRYRNQLELGVWMFRELNVPNARVYNFQTESDWTYDLDLYRDLSHYSQDINTRMAESIGRDDPRYRMTASNAQAFADKLEEQLARLVVSDDNRALDVRVVLRQDVEAGSAADAGRDSGAVGNAGTDEDNSTGAEAGTNAGSGSEASAGTNPGERELSFSRLAAPNADELLVPAKELAAALGAEAVWDPSAKELTLRRGERTLAVAPGTTVARLGAEALELDAAPRILEGTLLVPLLPVVDAMGAEASLSHPDEHSVLVQVTAAP